MSSTSFLDRSRPFLKGLYPTLRPKALATLSAVETVTGRQMRITDGRRDGALQAARFALGRTVPGPFATAANPLGRTVTNAEPGKSYHELGLAFDACFIGLDPYLERLADTDSRAANGLWRAYATAGELQGLTAGHYFTRVDSPHLEMRVMEAPTGLLRRLLIQGGINEVWAYLDRLRGVAVGTDWDAAA